MTLECSPSLKSLMACLGVAATPILSASIVLYYRMPHPGAVLWIVAVAGALFSLYRGLQTIFVHTCRLHLDAMGIEMRSFPGRVVRLDYGDIVDATLHERVNAVSRTDRLLVLCGTDVRRNRQGVRVIAYNLSVLSRESEADALAEIRKHTRLVIKRDRPSI